jgi:hypothetical protein
MFSVEGFFYVFPSFFADAQLVDPKFHSSFNAISSPETRIDAYHNVQNAAKLFTVIGP